MEEYLHMLQNTALFAGLPPRQLREALASSVAENVEEYKEEGTQDES